MNVYIRHVDDAGSSLLAVDVEVGEIDLLLAHVRSFGVYANGEVTKEVEPQFVVSVKGQSFLELVVGS